MNQHAREELDSRIRRAWPIALDEISQPSSAAGRIRARIDERISTGIEPDPNSPSHHATTERATGRWRRPAVALVSLVLLAGILGVGSLVFDRMQNTTDHVDLTDATGHVDSAIAATRRALDVASVTHVSKAWVGTEGESVDARALVERSDPIFTTTRVMAADGDWSYEQEQATRGTDGAVELATFGMRSIDGEWYERGPTGPRWEHVVADDGQGPSEPPVPLLGGRLIVEVLERYEGTWTLSPDGSSGLTRYEAPDGAATSELRAGISSRQIPEERPSGGANRPGLASTVQVWIDNETGLIRRLFIETYLRVDPSAAEPPFVTQEDVTIEYGAVSPVEAPEQVTDITLDEWCARNTGSCR
jgi:hypothetical protein